MGKITFITTLSSGNNPNTWELPQNHVMANKGDVGKKFINYYKGEDSVYAEDIFAKNKDIKPSKVPIFEYNELSKRTELVVDDGDTNLVMYLKTHPWFEKKYSITNKEMEANKKLSDFNKVEEALDLIKESGPNEIKATALAVLGFDYFSKTQAECVADLKEKAFKEPSKIIDTMKASDYVSRYIASLAFCNNIIKNNITNTAIIWSEGEGVIIPVAKGENGVDKLTEFLNNGTSESVTLMQEFQARVDKTQKLKAASKIDPEAAQEQLSAQAKEIEDLKRQLAAKDKKEEPVVVAVEDKDTPPVNKYADLTLEEAKSLYKEQKGEDVPTAKATKLTWIISQLS